MEWGEGNLGGNLQIDMQLEGYLSNLLTTFLCFLIYVNSN